MIVVACGVSYGQTKKGSFMVGGSMSIQRAQAPAISDGQYITVPSTSVTISPTVGYFILDNWVAGLSTSFSGSGSKTDDWSQRARAFSIGPITRYYFPFGKFAVFPEVSAKWRIEKYWYKSDIYPENESKTKTGTYNAGVGVAWFIANNVALEGILSYNQDNRHNTDFNTWKLVSFNVGLQFYIPAKTN